jgi:hypothetical protein
MSDGPIQWLTSIDSVKKNVHFKLANAPPLGNGSVFLVGQTFLNTTYTFITVLAPGTSYLTGDVLALDGRWLIGASSTYTAYLTVVSTGPGGSINSYTFTGTSNSSNLAWNDVTEGLQKTTIITTVTTVTRIARGYGDSELFFDYQANLMTSGMF